jgi:endonuclease-3
MRRDRIGKIVTILNKLYVFRKRKQNPFETLIGVVLSQRTKEEVSFPATDRLFARAKDLEGILKLSEKEIEKIIYPSGFYRQKARRIKQICKILKEKYRGKVPDRREELMELPGVGGKSADIVLSYAYGQSVIACDVHVVWISNQLGWTKSSNPEKVREDLHRLIPLEHRRTLNDILVQFGKETCRTGRPRCYACPIRKYCPSSGKWFRKYSGFTTRRVKRSHRLY